jgi:hypothetical protein
VGYLDKTKQTVTATFTKRGRELLANALAGAVDDSYVITKFALGDDEIDYSLYDESLSSNFRGRVIENMPLIEGFLNQQEIMNYFMTDAPEMAIAFELSNIPGQVVLEGQGDMIVIAPTTDNFDGVEEYEFVLGHDNISELYNPDTPPTSDFTFLISEQGSSPEGTPPIANFNHQAL